MANKTMEDPQFNIDDYDNIVILTGAGVSVASGIAPFRGPGGLWTDRDIEELATAQALRRDPRKVWDAFAGIRRQAAQTDPNMAHVAIAELEKRKPNTVVLTQNIDGLHQKAGSRNVVELHGSMARSRCTKCGRRAFKDAAVEFHTCDKCGGALRFDIVLFNENLDEAVMARTYEALEKTDLFIAVGTSGIVYPAAGFAQMAKYNGATVATVNVEGVHSSLYDFQFIGKAEEILPDLFKI